MAHPPRSVAEALSTALADLQARLGLLRVVSAPSAMLSSLNGLSQGHAQPKTAE